MLNQPIFGTAATLTAPIAGVLSTGWLPNQLFPAENANYLFNAASQASQEIISVLTAAGITPSGALTNQLNSAIVNAFNGTATGINKVRLTQPASLATLTLAAGKTLTSNNTITIASAADGASVVLPASGSLLGTNCAVTSVNPANPTGTTGAGAMMGLGATFTPVNSTRISVIVSFSSTIAGAGSYTMQVGYGPGAPPANGAAPTGAALSPIVSGQATAAGQVVGRCLMGVAGMSIGTTYWIDVSLGTASGLLTSISGVSIMAIEV
jgi:hypothetical protein